MYITYDQEKGVFVVEGIKIGNQANNDLRVLTGCCKSLNKTIGDFAKQNDNNAQVPQDTPLSLQDAISSGIGAIQNIEEKLIKRNSLDIAELKKEFKKVLIQKKYNIDYNKEMDITFNKFFRKDEKWWKRIKIGGSHLFSKKATIKGEINRWFRQLVDYEGGNTDLDKIQYQLIEKNLNQLFQNLKQHNENKQKKINNNRDDSSKSVGLNTAFDNSYNNII